MISIITPTIRESGLPLVKRALESQKFKEWEWLVGSPFDPKMGIWVKDDFKGGKWSLNRVYNALLKRSKGDLIVSWQDYTFVKPDTLDRLWYHYQLEPNAIVGAVGNKYEDETWTKQTWQDPRETNKYGQYYETTFDNIEWNFCAIPKKAMVEVGGFDEELDFKGLGMDGYGVNHRIADMGGYRFMLDQHIKTYSLGHGRVKNWDEDNLIHGGYNQRVKELKQQDKWPCLEYMK